LSFRFTIYESKNFPPVFSVIPQELVTLNSFQGLVTH
jgi:hypothetical protein